MNQIYLHGIAYSVGHKEPISSLEPLAREPGLLAKLQALGLAHYRRSTETPLALAAKVIEETLAHAPVHREDIEVVIYASSSVDSGAFNGHDFLRFSERAGLTHTTPIGISLLDCANFGAALRVAHHLVALGEARNVLLVTTDVCRDPEERLLRSALAVLSDGAASCLVSSAHASRIEVLSTSQTTNQLVREAVMPALANLTRTGISTAVHKLLSRTNLSPGSIGRIITNNINREAIRFLCVSAGFEYDQCFLENIGNFGHVFSADNLINLRTYLEDGAPPDEIVLMLSNSFGAWGLSALRIA